MTMLNREVRPGQVLVLWPAALRWKRNCLLRIASCWPCHAEILLPIHDLHFLKSLHHLSAEE